MKILFLVEDENNVTAANLIAALRQTKNDVDVISYYSGKEDQCSIVINNGCPNISFNRRVYSPTDYDAALLWCWGTAAVGRKYLRIFENAGVIVLNSTYDTEITDSKVSLTKMLAKEGVSTPRTVFYGVGSSVRSVCCVKEKLGSPPYVFKPDYGTQGLGIEFALSESKLEVFARNLQNQQGFLVQEFIGNSEKPISHYRVLVIGDSVISSAMKITASKPLAASNIARGGDVEFVRITNYLKTLALSATRTTGLKVAGVDIMTYTCGGEEKAVVLEVNDGPGTKTFDAHGLDVSAQIVDYFVRYANAQLVTSHQKRAALGRC